MGTPFDRAIEALAVFTMLSTAPAAAGQEPPDPPSSDDGSAEAAPADRIGEDAWSRGRSLAWRPCADLELTGLDCATFTVPRDYDRPRAGTFDLAVVRLPATGPKGARIGSLFFNPGGPGESGIDVALSVGAALDQRIRRHFDLVVWDPRGVGRSSGAPDCVGGSFAPPATGPVEWSAVLTQMRRTQAAANADCEARYADVLPYIGTNATVRDLDGLRAAAGDEALTYWGTSYGTRIGYVYALAYPGRVRAMLLSSPVGPNATRSDFAMGAGASPDSALGLVFEAHRGSADHYRAAMRGLSERTVPLPSGRRFTRWHVRLMLLTCSSSESSYGTAADFLRTVDLAVNGSGGDQAAAARTLDEMMEWPETIPIRGGATAFITCLDLGGRIDGSEQDRIARRLRAQAPITGWINTQALVYCEGMTVKPDPVPVDFGADGQTPMLIVGSTRDALTPYGWTVDMARAFRNSRVVTYVGGQHTPFLGAGSACVDRWGADYLLTLERPPVDVTCPSVLQGR